MAVPGVPAVCDNSSTQPLGAFIENTVEKFVVAEVGRLLKPVRQQQVYVGGLVKQQQKQIDGLGAICRVLEQLVEQIDERQAILAAQIDGLYAHIQESSVFQRTHTLSMPAITSLRSRSCSTDFRWALPRPSHLVLMAMGDPVILEAMLLALDSPSSRRLALAAPIISNCARALRTTATYRHGLFQRFHVQRHVAQQPPAQKSLPLFSSLQTTMIDAIGGGLADDAAARTLVTTPVEEKVTRDITFDILSWAYSPLQKHASSCDQRDDLGADRPTDNKSGLCDNSTSDCGSDELSSRMEVEPEGEPDEDASFDMCLSWVYDVGGNDTSATHANIFDVCLISWTRRPQFSQYVGRVYSALDVHDKARFRAVSHTMCACIRCCRFGNGILSANVQRSQAHCLVQHAQMPRALSLYEVLLYLSSSTTILSIIDLFRCHALLVSSRAYLEWGRCVTLDSPNKVTSVPLQTYFDGHYDEACFAFVRSRRADHHHEDAEQKEPYTQTAYIYGGFYPGTNSESDIAMASFECLHSLCGVWETLPLLQQPRVGSMTAVLGGQLYVCGGADHVHGATRAVHRYHPCSRAWDVIMPMWQAREHGIAVIAYERLYVCGGRVTCCENSDGWSSIPYAECYDPSVGQWHLLPTMLQYRALMAATFLQGSIYLCGGTIDGSISLNSVERLDVVTETWHAVPSMVQPRWSAIAKDIGSNIYIHGGYDISAPLGTTERFDVRSGAWELMPPPRRGRECAVVVVVLGQLHLFGGTAMEPEAKDTEWQNEDSPNGDEFESGGFLRCAERFNALSGCWERVPPMRERRACATAVEVGGRVCVCGGYNVSGVLDSAEGFDATTMTWTDLTPMRCQRHSAATPVF